MTKTRRIGWCILAVILLGFLGGLFLSYEIIAKAPPISPRDLLEELQKRPNYVSIHEIPKEMIRATLAAEDHRFYKHHGVDYLRLLRAVIYDLRHGALIQGGSTIPMQISKNHFTGFEKSFRRKILDIHYARCIEEVLSKEEILEVYLNTIGLSKGIEGVGAGAKYFFQKEVGELSRAESAYLVGITNWPVEYTPYLLSTPKGNSDQLWLCAKENEKKDSKLWEQFLQEGKITQEEHDLLMEGSLSLWEIRENPKTFQRQRYILDRMYTLGWISKEDHQKDL